MKKVLVVDDEYINRLLLSNIINTFYEDVQVLVANGYSQTMDVLNEHKPDLILLDIMMPKHNGFEIKEVLNGNTNTKDIPVIFVSALSEIHYKNRALLLGAVGYLEKPINLKLFAETIEPYVVD